MPKRPRFVVEQTNSGEVLRIPARRQLFVSLFLLLWLVGWAFGFASAAETLLTKGFQPFLVFWLCGWTLGDAFVIVTLLWMWTGSEILRVSFSDLAVRYVMLGFSLSKLYRADQIARLVAAPAPPWSARRTFAAPFGFGGSAGAMKFSYGARDVYLAAGLDETEGRLIVDYLARKLPKSATAA